MQFYGAPSGAMFEPIYLSTTSDLRDSIELMQIY